jgi:hypothetical protein
MTREGEIVSMSPERGKKDPTHCGGALEQPLAAWHRGGVTASCARPIRALSVSAPPPSTASILVSASDRRVCIAFSQHRLATQDRCRHHYEQSAVRTVYKHTNIVNRYLVLRDTTLKWSRGDRHFPHWGRAHKI